MTVTAQYAAEHFEELATAAAQGNEVCITSADGSLLDLRPREPKPQINPLFVDENGNRRFGVLRAPISLEEWEAAERDWDENVIPNLWMNRDDFE